MTRRSYARNPGSRRRQQVQAQNAYIVTLQRCPCQCHCQCLNFKFADHFFATADMTKRDPNDDLSYVDVNPPSSVPWGASLVHILEIFSSFQLSNMSSQLSSASSVSTRGCPSFYIISAIHYLDQGFVINLLLLLGASYGT
ncbi:hypothetical protein FIBSPDRAFT_348182 [Athelia psychrophila]|uniref:Uncharacterized protein n=1 Tax=Athelia psychrophila TaxID=1759441 RepID=A0A167W117_9AGAM|nr:hypothetical protein FIBSPDRAFT_348182 [Fibularhizoctonia sp. CBS 109695]